MVEDDDAVRLVIRAFLEKAGYRVLDAHDPSQAVLVSKRHNGPIHLLLIDVVLPGMSGPEHARRVTALRPKIKVLYISGYPQSVVRQYVLSGPRASFLQKPFSEKALLKKVREVLDTGKME